MRMFDNRNSWLDDEGKPLLGRVKFCKLHTTILENIYNMNGTVVYANPQYTNTIGQLQYQVFLKDNTDYTVRFQKYVGNGDMTEDQDNWLDVYSCDDIWNTYGIEVDSTTFQLVNNINDLRNTNPSTITTRDNHKVIILGGYNVIGDKPQVMYIWNPNNTDSDNGGDIIKVNNISNGRWELVNNFGPNGVDVRHFGVFGADSKAEATDIMSIRINTANQYAAYNSIPLYFPSINGLTWYKMNGLNLYKAVFAEETRVFGNTNYPNIITIYDENGYLDVYTDAGYKAVFTIRGPTVRTSWGVNSDNCIFEPSYKLIVDSAINTNHRDFSNIIVELIHETSNLQFDNCEIHSVNKLGDYIYFRNGKITESMFTTTTDYDTITITNDVVADIDDWPTTWKWLHIRTQKPDHTIDFKGRKLYANCNNIINWVGGVTFKNATFTNGFIITQSTIGLESCGGPVQMTASLQALVIDNCNIAITTTQLTARPNVVIKNNSEVTFSNGEFYAGEFAAHDSVIMGSVNASVHVVGSNSIFYNAITVHGVLNIQRCTVSGAIMQTANDANFVVTLINNTLGSTYYMYGAPLTQAVVSGRIEYNNSNAAQGMAIVIDRSNFDPDETHHNYSYKYNTGAFIPDLAVIQGTYLAKPRHYFSGSENSFAQNNQAYHAFVVPTSWNCGLIYNSTVPFENVSFFTIGTTNINVKMKVRTMVNTRTIPTSFTEIILKGIHVADYTWGLVAHVSGTWLPGAGGFYTWNAFPVTYPTMFIDGSAVKVEESSSLPSDYNIDMIIEYDILR